MELYGIFDTGEWKFYCKKCYKMLNKEESQQLIEKDTINMLETNNAIALLEECVINGKNGKDILYAWFLEEQGLIERTIKELTIWDTTTKIG